MSFTVFTHDGETGYTLTAYVIAKDGVYYASVSTRHVWDDDQRSDPMMFESRLDALRYLVRCVEKDGGEWIPEDEGEPMTCESCREVLA